MKFSKFVLYICFYVIYDILYKWMQGAFKQKLPQDVSNDDPASI